MGMALRSSSWGTARANEGLDRRLSVPVRTLGSMQLSEHELVCEWCGEGFVRRHERGRRPIYCDHTCRQRAYENRRRGANVIGLPKATTVERLHPDPKHYQSGAGGEYLNVLHAIRPDGCADYIGFRPTLCGTRVKPSPWPFYEQADAGGHCETCTRVARLFPPERNIDPVGDVGTATALIRMLASARGASESVLRAQVDEMLAAFGAPAGASRASRASPRLLRERGVTTSAA